MKTITFLLAMFVFSACGNDDVTIKDLESYGYRKTGCSRVDYIDLKNDENPYYYTYKDVDKIKNGLEIILARCIEKEQFCTFETIENKRVVCQRFVIVNNHDELVTEFDKDAVLLTFNAKDRK